MSCITSILFRGGICGSNVGVENFVLAAIIMRLVLTPYRVSVERLYLSTCVCRHLVCKSSNELTWETNARRHLAHRSEHKMIPWTLQPGSFTGATNHGLDAINTNAVKRESWETSRMAACIAAPKATALTELMNLLGPFPMKNSGINFLTKRNRAEPPTRTTSWTLRLTNPLSRRCFSMEPMKSRHGTTNRPPNPSTKEWCPRTANPALCEDPSCRNDALIVQQSASSKLQRMEHNLVDDQIAPASLLHDLVLRFTAAAARGPAVAVAVAVAVVAMAVAFCGRCSTRCIVLSSVCLSVFFEFLPSRLFG